MAISSKEAAQLLNNLNTAPKVQEPSVSVQPTVAQQQLSAPVHQGDDVSPQEASALVGELQKAPAQQPQQATIGQDVAGAIEGVPKAAYGMTEAAGDALRNQVRNTVNLISNAVGHPLNLSQVKTISDNYPGTTVGKIAGNLMGVIAATAAGGVGEAGEAATALPKFGSLVGKGAELAEQLPSKMEKLLPVAKRAIGFGTYGATQDPKSPLTGFSEGAVASPVADILGAGIPAVARGVLQPRKEIGGAVAKVSPIAAGAFGSIRNRLDNIVNELKGGSTKDSVQDDILNKLTDEYNKSKTNTNLLHQQMSSSSKGSPFDNTIFHGAIDDWGKSFAPKIKRAAGSPELTSGEDSALKRINAYKNFDTNSFAGAADVRQIMNADLRNKSLMDEAPILKRVINGSGDPNDPQGLRDALLSSTENSSGVNPVTKDLWEKFNTNFREKQLPFEKVPDAKTGKLTKQSPFMNALNQPKSKEKAGTMLKDYVKINRTTDDTSGINNLLKLLPDQESKHLVSYNLLKDVEGQPDKIMNVYKNIGSKQRKALFPNHFQELNDLENLKKKTPSAFAPSNIGKFEAIRAGMGGAYGAMHGGLEGGIAGAALGLTPEVLRGASTLAFKSPKLVDALIRNAQPITESTERGLSPLAQLVKKRAKQTILANLLAGGNR